MGFLDNVLQKVGASLATKYGTVTSGDNTGCKVVMGNPPTRKVTVGNDFSQIILLKDTDEKARYNIEGDVEDIEFLSLSEADYLCRLTLTNGESFEFNLYRSGVPVFVLNTYKRMSKETYDFFKKEFNID